MTPLVLPGERPTDTLNRLERLPGSEYLAVIGTPEYERIAKAARDEADAARRFTRRVERKGRA